MPVQINLFDIYRSPNIGIFLRANDKFSFVPRGLASTKGEKIAEYLGNRLVHISIAGSRLLGPLMALNNKGLIVSRLAEDEELETLRSITGLEVHKLESRFTSVGNLIAANDHGAVISKVFGEESTRFIERTLGVETHRMSISRYAQLGSMLCATNRGAIVHPAASEEEIQAISRVLKVEPEPATVNGGVPFVSAGFVGNTESILLGSMTRGGELVIIGRAFSS
jgi:translation initiation factor 6